MANRTLTTLTTVLQMNNTKFKKGIKGSQRSLNGFSKQVDKIGGMIAGAFAVGAITNFVKESVKLGSAMEGVAAAFNSLGRAGLLRDLQTATRGTVSNLMLMQSAVKAKNFKIPLEQLAGFFEFATNRAIQTGESVEYLTQSIIDGIGRKSSLVLDNLGISASELQEEIKKVGDFGLAAGNIIARSLEEAGDVASTTATTIAQMTTAWENFKTSVGQSKVIMFTLRNIGEAIEAINRLLNRGGAVGTDEFLEFSKILKDKEPAEQIRLLTAEIERQRKVFAVTAKERKKQQDLLDKGTSKFRHAEKQFAKEQIKQLDAIQTPLLAVLRFFEGQLKALQGINTELDGEKKTQEEIFKAWVKVNDAIRKRIDLQNELTDAMRESQDEALRGIIEGAKKKTGAAPAWSFGEDEVFIGAESHDALLDAVALAKKKADEMEARMRELKEGMNLMLEDFVSVGLASVFSMLGESLSTKNFDNFFADILEMFGRFMTQMGAMIIAYGVAMDAFKKAFSNPYAAIAAGIALTAIGGAIIGKAKNMRSLGSGTGVARAGNTYGGSAVNFRISGNDLVGTLERQNYSNYMNG